jgi:aspartyl-tRNA(Asn)/glutamyl-tRNA(Gln) amidotransferase subunit B
MRTKEEAHDYRYFPDPDLLPLEVSEEWIKQIKAQMPESLRSQYQKLVDYGVPRQQAKQLTATRASSEFALSTLKGAPREQVSGLANWILGPLSAKLNEENLDFSQSKVSNDQLKALSSRVADGTVSSSNAISVVFRAMWAGEGNPDAIIAKRGLKQISDSGELERICDQVIAANARQVEDYRSGKERAFNSLVGQVMKLTNGKANPQQVTEILKRKLSG